MKSSRLAIIMLSTILLSLQVTSQTTDSDEERAFRIKPRPCTDRHGAQGTCMFQWECRQRNGVMLATCLDRFLFGTCCQLPAVAEQDAEPSPPVTLIDNKVDIDTTDLKINHKVPNLSTATTTTLTTPVTVSTTSGAGQSTASATNLSDEALDAGLIADSHITFEGPGVLVSPTGSQNGSSQPNGTVGGGTYSTPDIDKLFHQFLGSVLSNYSDAEQTVAATKPTLFDYPPPEANANATGTQEHTISDVNFSNAIDSDVTEPADVASYETVAPPTSVEAYFVPVDDVALAVTELPLDGAVVSTITPALSSSTTSATTTTTNSSAVSVDQVLAVDPAVEYEYYDAYETTSSSASDPVTSGAPSPSVPAHPDVTGFDEPPLEDATEVVYDAELYEDEIMSTTTTTVASTTTTTPTTTTTTEPPTTTTKRRTTTKKPFDYHTDCGVRPLLPNGRIVGGTSSKFGEWPWQVLIKEATWLGLFVKNKCGGVLLNNRYVITAAHCQPSSFLASLLVVFGENDLSVSNEELKPLQRNVRRVVVHRKFNSLTFDNDLALLELERSVEYRPHIVPICLPPDDADYTSRVAVVTGWGRLKYGGRLPTDLQQVDVPIIPNSKCQQMFLTAGHIKAIGDKFICAGYQEGAKDSCEGDSGGPLVLEGEDGRWILIGTVSHGIKCAYPNLPGVYIKISAYKSWIQRIISS